MRHLQDLVGLTLDIAFIAGFYALLFIGARWLLHHVVGPLVRWWRTPRCTTCGRRRYTMFCPRCTRERGHDVTFCSQACLEQHEKGCFDP